MICDCDSCNFFQKKERKAHSIKINPVEAELFLSKVIMAIVISSEKWNFSGFPIHCVRNFGGKTAI